jgi:hypothetical protein
MRAFDACRATGLRSSEKNVAIEMNDDVCIEFRALDFRQASWKT